MHRGTDRGKERTTVNGPRARRVFIVRGGRRQCSRAHTRTRAVGRTVGRSGTRRRTGHGEHAVRRVPRAATGSLFDDRCDDGDTPRCTFTNETKRNRFAPAIVPIVRFHPESRNDCCVHHPSVALSEYRGPPVPAWSRSKRLTFRSGQFLAAHWLMHV